MKNLLLFIICGVIPNLLLSAAVSSISIIAKLSDYDWFPQKIAADLHKK
jgi:hypothetical protein